MTEDSTGVAGIDIAKRKLDVAVHGDSAGFCVPNERAGWREIAKRLHQAGVGRVGLEASGGYERGVANALREAGFIVIVMQPLQVKAFAKLRLRRAKNDRLDAALIAACTAAMDHTHTNHDPRFEALSDHLIFIEQIEEDLARVQTRLEHISPKRLRGIVERDLEWLQRRRKAELALLLAAIRQFVDLARRIELVLSIPGIGERTAVALVVHMPELGQLTREQAASLAGLAPFDRDSGTMKGERHIGGGRARLRRSLYIAALPAAMHWNPPLCAFYKRLVARGLKPKLVLTAAARKLLIIANAVVQRQSPWQDRAAAPAS